MGLVGSLAKMSPEDKAKYKEAQVLFAKKWVELTADEKIERMRDQVKYKIDCTERTNKSLRRKIDKLMNHSHDAHDRIVSVISPYDNEESLGGYSNNNEWF
jgi:hypothetical protein